MMLSDAAIGVMRDLRALGYGTRTIAAELAALGLDGAHRATVRRVLADGAKGSGER